MKKLFLTSSVILLFAAYSFFIRQTTPQLPLTTSRPSAISYSPPANSPANATLKDGVFTGVSADAFYGNIQVRATVTGGRITDVVFLQYPSDRDTSREINAYAMPLLSQEAISAQSANVDVVSGATDTSRAFIESLSSALTQAK